MNSFAKIRDIFYSGSYAFMGGSEVINDIMFLISENYLALSKEIVAGKSEYLTLLNNSTELKQRYEAHGGTFEHIALKILGANFLKKHRLRDFVFEHPFCGYYPDVLSSDESIIIECGHTQNPEKILAYFQNSQARECIQIPYPSEEDDSVYGYSFRALDDIKQFLSFVEKERRQQMRDLMRKKGS